tara:strand:+ start:207 stop:590 length:384 start_codon:yes stop_codon:yes gene_type:complete
MVKHNPMDDALTELMDAWMDLMSVTNRPLSTPVSKPNNIGDWEDRNGEIAITVDMPGISKKDIKLTVDTHKVVVSAANEDGGRDYSFTKAFKTELNPEDVSAEFNNGVLDIKIQKAEEHKGKDIKIK